jgi:hypothetical protein
VEPVAEKKQTALRLPADLMEWAKDYAKSKNTSVTALIVAHLTELREQHEKNHVDQI